MKKGSYRKIFKRIRKINPIFLFLFALFLLLLFFNFLNLPLLWDEAAYLGNARSHISVSNFTEDFRFPLLEWLVASVWLITGESIFFARLLVIALAILSSYLFYLISLNYFSKRASLFATIFFSISSLILLWGLRVYADV